MQEGGNSGEKGERWAWWVVVALTLLYVVFFSALSIRQHQAFMTYGFDLGNVDQAVWNTLHGRFLRMTNEEGTESRLGTHFDPIIALLAPLYLIHSGPETLLVVQTIALALGAWPIFWLAKKKLENAWAAAAFALVYLGLPAVEGTNLFEFHALSLGAGFLVWAFYFLEGDRDVLFVLFSVLAMNCKEDLALIVTVMGIYAILFRKKRRLGLAMALLGILWFFVAVKVVIPHFNEFGRSIQLTRYGYLGDSVEEVLVTVVTKPGLVLESFRKDPLKSLYLAKLLFPVGYLSLLAPQILLLPSSSLLINLLSTQHEMYTLDMFHYSVAIMPFVVLSAVWGVAVLGRFFHRLLKVKKQFVVVVLTGYVLFLSGFYHQQLGYSPFGNGFHWPQVTDHDRLGQQLANSIPQEAVVTSQNHLNSHLSQRRTGYIFPNIHDAEYIFLDVSGPIDPPLDHEEYHRAVEDTLNDERFGIIFSQDGYIILRREAPRAPLSKEFYGFLLADDLGEASPLSVRFGDEVRLSGLQLLYQHGMIVEVHSYWQAVQTSEDDLHLFVCLADEDGVPISGTAIEMRASIWYPPPRWAPQQIVHSTERIQLPAYVDLSTLSLGFFVGPPAAIADASARLPVVIEDAGSVETGVKQGMLVMPIGTRTD